MKVYICSDIHNQFHKFPAVPDVDLILCAGDITNQGNKDTFNNGQATRWMEKVTGLGQIPMLYVPGNHDIGWGQEEQTSYASNILNRVGRLGKTEHLKYNLSVCGASMSPCYDMPGLATYWDNMTCNPEIEAAYYESIEPCDILLSHGPPSGSLGFCTSQQKDFGSKELRKWIIKHQPKLVVCGHIHDPHLEQEWIGRTRVINTATKWSVIEL